MTKRLFVGGLSWDTDEHGLRAAFEKFGALSDVKIVLDRDTGRSRGFGFITFDDDASADNAMAEHADGGMNGAELDGRYLTVNEARERTPRGRGGGGGYDRGGGDRDRGGGGGGRGGRGGRGRRGGGGGGGGGGDRW